MAVDNLAIEMRPLHGDHVIDIESDLHDDYIGGSYAQLITRDEENPRKSLSASVRESVRSTVSKVSRVKKKWWSALKPIKTILFKLKLLIVIAIYSVFGAWLFMHLEVPTDLAAKQVQYNQRFIARDNLIIRLREIHQTNRENREEKWKEAILGFEKNLDMDEPVVETSWTFWMSFLYAGTIFTTIGYGNIACATTAGQVATVIYAIFGIPIMIVILNDLGDVLLFMVKGFTHGVADIMLFVTVKLGVYGLEEGTEQRKRFNQISKRFGRFGLGSTTSISTLTTQDALTKDGDEDEEDQEVKRDPPVIQAVVATIGWIMFASGVFCLWEDWSYWTSIYFFFISTSTIGLGDVTPAHPEYMIATFMIVIVGLSLVNVCINVVCEKLEMMYLALLTKMAEDYQKALESGDPKAIEGMMSGFQGKAKFLMPLISKNAGSKVMNKFKQEAKAKGIDIPPVLTNLDPQTGLPAFAKADRGDFRDFIEAAEVKKQQLDRIDQLFNERQAKASTASRALLVNTSMTTEDFQVKVKKECHEAACQAWSMDDLFHEWKPNCHQEIQTRPEMVDEHSYEAQCSIENGDVEIQVEWDLIDHGIQCSAECSDSEAQTSYESIDEGIQVWSSMEEVSTQYDPEFIEGIHVQTQVIDLEERGCQCGPSTSGVSDMGTQPEVSMLYHEIDDDQGDDLPSTPSYSAFSSVSEWSLFEGPDSEDEAIRKEETRLQREAPELETIKRQVDEWSDMSDIDPLGAEMEEKERKRLWSEKVRLHEEKLKNLEERKKMRDEKRQKRREEMEGAKKQRQEEREKRRKEKQEERERMRNQIRFMKNSGDQTEYLIELDEGAKKARNTSTTQTFEAEKFAKRTQTKLTSIEPAELQALQQLKKQTGRASSLLLAMGPSFSAVSASLSSPLPSPQTTADREEKVVERTKIDSQGLPVAEISVDLDLVKIPVDEFGVEIFSNEDYDQEIGDDNVFYSDEDDMTGEMEAYSINQYTQTDQSTNKERQTQVSAGSLGLLADGIAQTAVSGFKQTTRPKLPRQERISIAETSTPSVIEKQQDIPEPSSSEQTGPSEPESAKESEAEVSDEWRQRLSRKETSSEKKSFEILPPDRIDDEVYFMKESGVQTERSGFIRKEIESQKSEEEGVRSDSDQVDEIVRFMVNGTSQTDSVYDTSGAQTERSTRIDGESQTFIERVDIGEQTMAEYSNTGAQSEVTNIQHEQTVSEIDSEIDDLRFMVSSSTQFEIDSRDVESQISPITATISTEYFIDLKEASITVKPEMSSVEISCVPQVSSTSSSTIRTVLVESASQAVVDTIDHHTQIESSSTTILIGPDTHSSVIEVQTDDLPIWPELPTHQLWSDFDVVLREEPDASSEGGLLEERDPWEDEEPSGPPLWSDFDVVALAGDEKSQSEVQSMAASLGMSVESLTRPPSRLGHREISCQTEISERRDQSIGTEDAEWIKLYVDDLEAERRRRRKDVGIQTGVLSRVEHLYGKKVTLTSEDSEERQLQSTSGQRLGESDRLESFGEAGVKKASSDESLQMQRAAEPRPFGKKRSTSFKKLKSVAAERRELDKQQTVQDLRSRFERARLEQQMQKRDSSTD